MPRRIERLDQSSDEGEDDDGFQVLEPAPMRGAKRRRVEDVRSSPSPIPDEELGFMNQAMTTYQRYYPRVKMSWFEEVQPLREV
jgi:hypothetical protein